MSVGPGQNERPIPRDSRSNIKHEQSTRPLISFPWVNWYSSVGGWWWDRFYRTTGTDENPNQNECTGRYLTPGSGNPLQKFPTKVTNGEFESKRRTKILLVKKEKRINCVTDLHSYRTLTESRVVRSESKTPAQSPSLKCTQVNG